jgi:membrane protease YdiL (CAAX protease family)
VATPPDEALRIGGVAVGVTLGLAAAALIVGLGPSLANTLLVATGVTGAATGEMLFTLLIFGALLLVGILGGALFGLQAWRPGRRPGPMLAIGLGLGAAGLFAAAGFASLAGTLRHGGAAPVLPGLLLLGCVTVLVQVSAEEVYFRGWLQPLLARATGKPIAVGGIAIAFAALHGLAGQHGALEIVNLALGGLLFGLLAARGGGIAGAVGAHAAWNLSEQLVLGLDPNPGIGSFGALIDLDLVGPALWGGSTDGLNASWAMAFALLASIAPLAVLWWRRPLPPHSAARPPYRAVAGS